MTWCPNRILAWLRSQYFGHAEHDHLDIGEDVKKRVSKAAHALNNETMAHQSAARDLKKQAHAMMMIVKGHRDVLG